MRVLICGGRDFSDADFMDRYLRIVDRRYVIKHVIQGGARGADRLAKNWAEGCGVPVTEYRADWSKYGKAAGPRRNQQMIDEGKPDLVIAFGGGRGTADMVRKAEAAGIKVFRSPPHPAP